MEIILQLFNGIIGIALLYFGAEWLVKGSSALAKKAGISPLVIGLTLVAFATSAPELVVSVNAALDGSPGISLGNIVGSNICNIALILGLCACITPLSVQKQLFKSDGVVMCASAILLAVFYLVKIHCAPPNNLVKIYFEIPILRRYWRSGKDGKIRCKIRFTINICSVITPSRPL